MMERDSLNTTEISTAALGFYYLRGVDFGNGKKEGKGIRLNKMLDRFPKIRRAYVWRLMEESSLQGKSPDKLLSYFFLSRGDLVSCKVSDLDWLVEDIRGDTNPEVKQALLKLALDIWWFEGKRNRIRLAQIRSAVPRSPDLRKLFRKEAVTGIRYWYQWLRQRVRNRRMRPKIWGGKIKEYALDFYYSLYNRIWLLKNLSGLRNGTLTGPLLRLAQEGDGVSSRWGIRSWDGLEAKRGKSVAHAVKDGCKRVWKNYNPELPHEMLHPNQTDHRVILGLTGIKAALTDGDLRLDSMNPNDAKLATRYAISELNEFPEWLKTLTVYNPQPVREILAECIRGEWRISQDAEQDSKSFKGHRPKILEMLPHLDQEVLGLVEEIVIEELERSDPSTTQSLEAVLAALLKSTSSHRVRLSKLATHRTSTSDANSPRFTLWMAIWLQLESAQAVEYLKSTLPRATNPKATMVALCASLDFHHHRRRILVSDPDYLSPRTMKELVPLVYKYVREDDEDEIDRTQGGSYTPNERDAAQDFRGGLIERLASISGNQMVDEVLSYFTTVPDLSRIKDRLLHHLDVRAETVPESAPWEPKDIREFMVSHETPPNSNHELFKMIIKRLASIRESVEIGDTSNRHDLHPSDDEARLRDWLVNQLRERSRGWYTVVPEEEVDLGQPDIRIERPGIGSISIEIKLADKRNLSNLKKGLVNQLVGQYLRAPKANYGIYILGFIGKESPKSWLNSNSKEKLSLVQMVEHLQTIADEEMGRNKNVYGLKVLGIDFFTRN